MLEIKLINSAMSQNAKDEVVGMALMYEIVGGKVDGIEVRAYKVFDPPLAIADYTIQREAIIQTVKEDLRLTLAEIEK